MQIHETSTQMPKFFYNLFLNLESIGNNGEECDKNVVPNPAEKYLLKIQYKLQTKQNLDIVHLLHLKMIKT